MPHIHQTYSQIELSSRIEGANPHDLISLLFDGANRKILRAKGHIKSGNHQLRNRELSKVMLIMDELISCIDQNHSSTVGEQLHSLYLYINELVVHANLNNEPDKLDEAHYLLTHISDSWAMIPMEMRSRK